MINSNYKIIFPDVKQALDQDEEWVTVDFETHQEKVRFHDYDKIYQIEGLYEKIFYEKLQCESPRVLSEMLFNAIEKEQENPKELRILDFGAGNGMVGERLSEFNPELIVGVDILEEAKMAQQRDRAEVYDDYHVLDMGELESAEAEQLKAYDFNTLITVAALGFDDIPPQSLINSFNLIEENGWFAFNIRDKFLTQKDNTGFSEVIDWLSEEHLAIKDEKKYLHRYSVAGEPLEYIAFVGKKLQDVKQ